MSGETGRIEAAARAQYEANPIHRARWVQLSVGYKRELIIPAIAALAAADADDLANGIRRVRVEEVKADAWDEAIQYADDVGYLYTYQSEALKALNPHRKDLP